MAKDIRFLPSLVVLLFGAIALAADPATRPAPSTQPASTTRPVIVGTGPVADLLLKWYAEGTAAGNVGDWYDNRDRGHSLLALGEFPQLKKVHYTADDQKAKRDWALQPRLLPIVVFGNSSTSSTVNEGGSNVRTYYVYPEGLNFLYAEYTHNNLYMYPEHCDHRPGHNGTPNHGDLYPTNTPFLITSQGSSWSDQPFMHAVPYTMAAFRPEVKKKLIDTGLLMPTVQMILRASNKQVKNAADYFTGIAQPSVFDGTKVDPVKMIQMAHDMTLQTIPPMVQLHVIKEDSALPGIDYFEQDYTEALATTPAVIARVFRSAAWSRTMIVSAEGSYDINHRPLTYTWSLLQGDSAKVKITPMNRAGSIVQIVVDYPDRRPIQPGSPLDSNRVDIGVFVNNGVYTSAPGFITWYSLDNEARTYDKTGKVLEIGYGMGDPSVTVASWPALFALLPADAPATAPASTTRPASPGSALLTSQFSPEQLRSLKQAAVDYARPAADLAAAEQNRNKADAADKKTDKAAKPAADAALKSADSAFQAATTARQKVLTQPRPGASQGVKALVENALNRLAADPMFWKSHAADFADAKDQSTVAKLFQRLIELGIANRHDQWTALLGDPLTRFERAQIEHFNDDLIADVILPGAASAVWRENFVDPRLTAAKNWRDLYHYDAAGQRTGWTRYAPGQSPWEFNSDGMLIVKSDSAGHATDLQGVRYERPDAEKGPLHEIAGHGANPQ